MLILLLGPPGSGKGTQAKRLVEYFHFNHISTGDLLRSLPTTTSLGCQIANLLSAGKFVPDTLVLNLIKDKLVPDVHHNGVILDGFPRNMIQVHAFATFLARQHIHLNAAIHIQVPDALVIQRLDNRRHDPQTGQIYNLIHLQDPLPTQITARLEQRTDDTKEAIQERLSIYHRITAPVIAHYAKNNLLLTVNGNLNPDLVFCSIVRHIETLNH